MFVCLFFSGIEAEAVMLGQAISMLLPQVLGYQLTGTLNQFATSTDLVLTITKVKYKRHCCSAVYYFIKINLINYNCSSTYDKLV